MFKSECINEIIGNWLYEFIKNLIIMTVFQGVYRRKNRIKNINKNGIKKVKKKIKIVELKTRK